MSSRTPGGKKQTTLAAFFAPKSGKNNNSNALKTPNAVTKSVTATPKGLSSKTKLVEKTPSTPINALGETIIGKSIRVFWPADDLWYEGEVTEFDNASGKHTVVYRDGDVETLNLHREKYEILTKTPGTCVVTNSAVQRRLTGKSKLKNKKKVIESDSDWENDPDECIDDEGVDALELDDDMDLDDILETTVASKKKRKRNLTQEIPSTAQKTVNNAKRSKNLESAMKTPKSLNFGPCEKLSEAKRTPFTPASDAGELMRKALNLDAPSIVKGDSTPLVSGISVNPTPEADRFTHRALDKFEWLRPEKIRDAEGRRPNDESYDASTVLIPDDWFKTHKISEGQKQWWEFKAAHFDSVLLFKMGKFYEMFEMDAHVGADVLGLQYMKGDKPHAGFPEAKYHHYAEALARSGYKVVVVEQTETPEQLKIRNEEAKAQNRPTSRIVRREKVAVLTKGTLRDAEMVQTHPDPAYLMAIIEVSSPFEMGNNGRKAVGICAVDVASVHIIFGQFWDDELMGNLRTHVAALQPVELLLPNTEECLSASTRKLLRSCLNSPRINNLAVNTETGFLSPIIAANKLKEYFSTTENTMSDSKFTENGEKIGEKMGENGGKIKVPEVLKGILNEPQSHFAALHAFGAVMSFLSEALLDASVIPHARIDVLGDEEQSIKKADSLMDGPKRILLDSSALENLEVLHNSEGGSKGSLLSTMDNCTTPFGRRLLRQWLCKPLGRVREIQVRQGAVGDLLGVAASCAGKARKILCGIGDLERALARLHASTLEGVAGGRDAQHVVLYEDAAKRKVGALVSALKGLQAAQEAVCCFQSVMGELTSPLLKSLVTPGSAFPDMSDALNEMLNAADWNAAQSTGRVVPSEGIVPEFDAAKEAVQNVQNDLNEYLVEIQSMLGGRSIRYVSINKESHLLEVPETLVHKIPHDFELIAQRKGFRRYMTPDLRDLVNAHEKAEQKREVELENILQGLVKKFVSQQSLWSSCVSSTSQLDALMSLAQAAAHTDGPVCCPKFVTAPQSDRCPVFRARGLRHPCAFVTVSGTGSGFVPNDVEMGGEGSAPLILLTGPNMGGKSTLLRQVGLATLLAQVGAFVPAEELELSPVDAIFVRMGARDHILSGQSTFYVELSETAGMLRTATKHSLVALDELGRGTATSDGAAIAFAVLHHVTQTIGCRGLFATHYHTLAIDHANVPKVSIRHMGCRVAPSSDPSKKGTEEVIFLYKLAHGACPRSYGTNVARLAGLPDSVVTKSAEISAEMDNGGLVRQGGGIGEMNGLGMVKKLTEVKELVWKLKKCEMSEKSEHLEAVVKEVVMRAREISMDGC